MESGFAPAAVRHEQNMDICAFACFVSGRHMGTAAVYAGDSGAWIYRTDPDGLESGYTGSAAGHTSAGSRLYYRREDWIWGWLADIGAWHVAGQYRTYSYAFDREQPGLCMRNLPEKKRSTVRSVFGSCICDRRMAMKKRGRFVLEAAFLVPGISLFLVCTVMLTLYAHDYAVCVHTILESGVKGIYREGSSGGQTEEKISRDLEQKLSERLLWVREPEVKVSVNPVRVSVQVTGSGMVFPPKAIEIQQQIYRIQTSETVRKSRWLRD